MYLHEKPQKHSQVTLLTTGRSWKLNTGTPSSCATSAASHDASTSSRAGRASLRMCATRPAGKATSSGRCGLDYLVYGQQAGDEAGGGREADGYYSVTIGVVTRPAGKTPQKASIEGQRGVSAT
ncbi:hypothetical protein E2C01_077484 [Portunus trituberculatus]|uniref:Uncharacterized protein n=1 Tax=Portunus trituberculatus TaxID=210409 RepID=A0A5B7IBI9_PORTR|nr:hypothetical protein [Portunus trituberculatus]